ncbi:MULTISPECIES: hypothetical protein [unclassified Streptomyces]|uniref:hypothetical protein n=1 Tax=Streptomyces sp. NPDC127532 TaxID=3345399 RepID=UPI00363F66DC
MIETVYDGQDHHEDRMYPTFGDPEPCASAKNSPPTRYGPRTRTCLASCLATTATGPGVTAGGDGRRDRLGGGVDDGDRSADVLAAQARAPSALTITVVGIAPTATATATATDATVARSMTRTVSAPWSATYACAPVELMAMSKRRSRPGT